MNELNPITWFGQRELLFVPKHFVRAPTPLHTQALFWVRTKLSGRYSYQNNCDNSIIFQESLVIYFEDPQEVTMYELRWSGTNIFS